MALAGIGDRDRGEEGLGVGVGGVLEDLGSGALLDDLAEVHDREGVGEGGDDGEVVGDEEDGEVEGGLEVEEEIEKTPPRTDPASSLETSGPPILGNFLSVSPDTSQMGGNTEPRGGRHEHRNEDSRADLDDQLPARRGPAPHREAGGGRRERPLPRPLRLELQDHRQAGRPPGRLPGGDRGHPQ